MTAPDPELIARLKAHATWLELKSPCNAFGAPTDIRAAIAALLERPPLLRVDMAGVPVLVLGDGARRHLEAINGERAQFRLEIARLTAERDAARAALQRAAEQFELYAVMHHAKGPGGEDKARLNEMMAQMCRRALAPQPAPDAEGG